MGDDRLIMYTREGCLLCNQMKAKLQAKKISFEEKDVDKHINELVGCPYTMLPIFVKNGKYINPLEVENIGESNEFNIN